MGLIFKQPEARDDDGDLVTFDRNMSFEVYPLTGMLDIDIFGDSYSEDGCEVVQFQRGMTLTATEARQLRDFLNANVKD